MRPLPDESLLAGFASRDPGATAAFVRRFQGRVFGLALTILKEPAIAEEIAQETFVRAWEHAGVFDARRGRVDTWLLTIARNLAIDALRLRGRDMNVLEETSLLYLSGAEPNTERDGMLAVEVGRLRRAIMELPEEQRRVLVLAAFQGWTSREISEREGIPQGTAKTRLRAAMLRLRTTLGVTHE
jgi:RNA polymerase sigma factor (sigma-70 family)